MLDMFLSSKVRTCLRQSCNNKNSAFTWRIRNDLAFTRVLQRLEGILLCTVVKSIKCDVKYTILLTPRDFDYNLVGVGTFVWSPERNVYNSKESLTFSRENFEFKERAWLSGVPNSPPPPC